MTTAIMNIDDVRMDRFLNGDGTAFTELVEEHRAALVGFFWSKVGDVYRAEDLAQETFLAIYMNASQYVPGGRFVGWMYTVARNLLIDNVRRSKVDAMHAAAGHSEFGEFDMLSQVAGGNETPDAIAESDDLIETVAQMSEELPAILREVFQMHFLRCMSIAEIVESTGMPVSMCKGRLRMAKAAMVEKTKRLKAVA